MNALTKCLVTHVDSIINCAYGLHQLRQSGPVWESIIPSTWSCSAKSMRALPPSPLSLAHSLTYLLTLPWLAAALASSLCSSSSSSLHSQSPSSVLCRWPLEPGTRRTWMQAQKRKGKKKESPSHMQLYVQDTSVFFLFPAPPQVKTGAKHLNERNTYPCYKYA